VASCCAGRQAAGLGSGAYLLEYEVQPDEPDPRTVEISTRLYSAAATTRCLEFKLHWHSRSRAYSIELFNNVHFHVR
jgi:hypothetical protein